MLHYEYIRRSLGIREMGQKIDRNIDKRKALIMAYGKVGRDEEHITKRARKLKSSDFFSKDIESDRIR